MQKWVAEPVLMLDLLWQNVENSPDFGHKFASKTDAWNTSNYSLRVISTHQLKIKNSELNLLVAESETPTWCEKWLTSSLFNPRRKQTKSIF